MQAPSDKDYKREQIERIVYSNEDKCFRKEQQILCIVAPCGREQEEDIFS